MTAEEFLELKKLNTFTGKVLTDSMVPIIHPGETVTVEVAQMNLKRFDIIVILIDGKLVCHYLWQMNKLVKPLLLQTRNVSGQVDWPVTEKEYLGRVISHRINFFRKIWLLF